MGRALATGKRWAQGLVYPGRGSGSLHSFITLIPTLLSLRLCQLTKQNLRFSDQRVSPIQIVLVQGLLGLGEKRANLCQPVSCSSELSDRLMPFRPVLRRSDLVQNLLSARNSAVLAGAGQLTDGRHFRRLPRRGLLRRCRSRCCCIFCRLCLDSVRRFLFVMRSLVWLWRRRRRRRL